MDQSIVGSVILVEHRNILKHLETSWNPRKLDNTSIPTAFISAPIFCSCRSWKRRFVTMWAATCNQPGFNDLDPSHPASDCPIEEPDAMDFLIFKHLFLPTAFQPCKRLGKPWASGVLGSWLRLPLGLSGLNQKAYIKSIQIPLVFGAYKRLMCFGGWTWLNHSNQITSAFYVESISLMAS